MKPRIRFLNFVHRPCYFKPVKWCITAECARFFWPEDSRIGFLLMSGKIWGWKEHAASMQIYFGCMVLDDYKYRYTEKINGLVCLHFSKRIEINHPPMPDFKWDIENGFNDPEDGIPDEPF